MYRAKNSLFLLIFISITFSIETNNAARILATVSIPSYSHQIAFRPIWKELARRGHEIVLLTTDPMKEDIENIKQIDLSFSYGILEKFNFSSIVSNADISLFQSISYIVEALSEANKQQLQHPDVQRLINNKSEKFDLLMVEVLFTTHLGFADVYKVPIIGLTSMDAPQVIHEIMGNVIHPVTSPDKSIPYSFPPSFWERLTSTLSQMVLKVYGEYFILPQHEEIHRTAFHGNGRSLLDLCENIDMLFLNVNPIFHTIRALTPNTITFGGATHLESEPQPLPKDLKGILDSANQGFIYFSLGSNVKSFMLKDEIKKIILDVFAELPYIILWKFENEHLPNKPDNVILRKWLPQSDVLNHPNIKLFITQCGLQSLEEAIMSHVPIVGLPFFADQEGNSVVVKNKGMGKTLDIKNLSTEIFKETILEVIENPEYKENVQKVESLITDVEMTGLEKAVWWTEYVLRHKGAKHLRNPVLHVPYYQYFLLDVWAFVIIVIIFTSWGIKTLLRMCLSKLYRRK